MDAKDRHRSHAKLTWEQVREIRHRYTEYHEPQTELTRRYGVSAANMSCILSNTTWTDPNYTPPRRARNPRHKPGAKLNWPTVRNLRERYAAGGITMRALADEHHITAKAISDLIHNRTWRDPDYTPPQR